MHIIVTYRDEHTKGISIKKKNHIYKYFKHSPFVLNRFKLNYILYKYTHMTCVKRKSIVSFYSTAGLQSTKMYTLTRCTYFIVELVEL